MLITARCLLVGLGLGLGLDNFSVWSDSGYALLSFVSSFKPVTLYSSEN